MNYKNNYTDYMTDLLDASKCLESYRDALPEIARTPYTQFIPFTSRKDDFQARLDSIMDQLDQLQRELDQRKENKS